MIRYQTHALTIEKRIAHVNRSIEKTPLKVGKAALAGHLRELEEELPQQNLNVHTRIIDSQCSCWLSLELTTPARVELDIVFRTKGHIDHKNGELTKVFVRRWPQSGLNPEFFAAWCVDCGYLHVVDPAAAKKMRVKIDHVCPKDALVEAVLKQLNKSIIKPNTKPIVAGSDSWNAAIRKAILVIQEAAG